jgi:hypothetical protein
MSTATESGHRRSRAWAVQGLSVCAGAALSAFAAQTWLADSPYAFPVTHRPLLTALLALASAVDWFEGVKVVVILGASWPLMLDAARWLLGPPAAPPPGRKAVRRSRPPPPFGLETAR